MRRQQGRGDAYEDDTYHNCQADQRQAVAPKAPRPQLPSTSRDDVQCPVDADAAARGPWGLKRKGKMSTFVLVHGGCHDGSAWDGVIRRLNELGHKAFGPTVAGHGIDARKAVSHAESTRSIVDFIVDNGLTDIVLVGHSYGGTIISKVAEEIPESIRRLVFHSAFLIAAYQKKAAKCEKLGEQKLFQHVQTRLLFVGLFCKCFSFQDVL